MYRRLLLRLPKEEGEQLYKEEDAFVYSAVVVVRNAHALRRATTDASGSWKRRWENTNKPRL